MILFRYGITKAIDHWKHVDNLTINQKSKCLKRDIDNGPYHVFGCHEKCDPLVNINLNVYTLK